MSGNINMVKDFMHLPTQPFFFFFPTQPFVRIAGLILMSAVRDCIPLGGPVPYNSIGTIYQNYSLSPVAIIPLNMILFFSPQLAMLA